MSLGERNRFFAFLFSVTTARGIPIFIIPLYFVSVGIPILDVGVALAVNGASILVFEVMWGFLVDRRGAEDLLPWMVGIASLTYLSLPFVRTPEAAIAVEFLLGVTAPAFAVVARAMVVRDQHSSGWARGFGLLGSLFAFSFVVGSLLGSETGGLIGFADSFYLAAVATVAVYLAYLVRRQRLARPDLASAPSPTSTEASPAAPRRVAWVGLSALCAVAVPSFMGFSFFTNLMQLVITQTVFGTALQAGVVVAAFYVSTAVFAPILPSRAAGHARRWIAVGLVANFGVFAFLTQTHSVLGLAVAALMEGACYATISPLTLSLLMVEIPKSYAGRVMGVYGAAEDVGLIIGPIVGSLVWIEVGLSEAYVTLGIAYLVALVPFLLITMRRDVGAKR